MDLLVLGAVVLVLTLVVYLLATLGTKETPFEDAIAEQRQKFELENAQSKTEKQPKKPKVGTMKTNTYFFATFNILQYFVYKELSILNKLCMVHKSAIDIDSSNFYYKYKINLNPLLYRISVCMLTMNTALLDRVVKGFSFC